MLEPHSWILQFAPQLGAQHFDLVRAPTPGVDVDARRQRLDIVQELDQVEGAHFL